MLTRAESQRIGQPLALFDTRLKQDGKIVFGVQIKESMMIIHLSITESIKQIMSDVDTAELHCVTVRPCLTPRPNHWHPAGNDDSPYSSRKVYY